MHVYSNFGRHPIIYVMSQIESCPNSKKKMLYNFFQVWWCPNSNRLKEDGRNCHPNSTWTTFILGHNIYTQKPCLPTRHHRLTSSSPATRMSISRRSCHLHSYWLIIIDLSHNALQKYHLVHQPDDSEVAWESYFFHSVIQRMSPLMNNGLAALKQQQYPLILLLC